MADYFITAAVILLAAIIYNCPINLGQQDLQLIEPIIANLESLASHGDTERLEHIRASCIKLRDAAKYLLDQAGTGKGFESATTASQLAYQHGQLYDWLYPDAGTVGVPTTDCDYVDR